MWAKLKQQVWEWRGVLIAAPSVTVFLIALRLVGLLQPLELAALDQFFRLRPPENADERILIVGINETDIQKLKKWPTSDQVIAKLLLKVKQQQPVAIGLDLYRDFPVEPGHQALVKIFETTPNLIGIEKKIGDSTGSAIKPPPVLKKLERVGVNDVVLDLDGRLRRGLLYLITADGTSASLGLRLALIYLETKGITPEATDNQFLKLGKAVFVPFEANDGGYVRADAGGYQILLNFRGAAQSFQIVSLSDVLEDKVPHSLIRGRIVLIGVTAASINDRFFTPYSNSFSTTPEQTSGVETHANLSSQIISAALEGRSLLKVWAEPWEWLWILGWATVGATLSWKWRHVSQSDRGIPSMTAALLLTASSLTAGSFVAFLGGWWIPVVPALLALLGSVIVITGHIARTAADIRSYFGRYLTDEVVASLLETPAGLNFNGERRKVTILMSDLRGFSSASEQMPPEKVLSFLNIYLEIMTDVITQYQGTIDEFTGDGILVIFGAPTQRADDAQRAVACALAMQLAMEKVNQHKELLGLAKIEMGIGINTGVVVVGNIGSVKRAKYGIVGSHINLTARIESYTVGGQILISESTQQEVGSDLHIEGETQVQTKGFKNVITLYEVRGLGGKHNLFLPQITDVLLPLPREIPLEYIIIDGKHLNQDVLTGALVKLSVNGAEIRSSYLLQPFSNIKVNLFTGLDKPEISRDIYAKVLGTTGNETHFIIRFTFIPQEVAALLHEIHAACASSTSSILIDKLES